MEEERPPSMAASEIVQLQQRHTVSGLRYVDLVGMIHFVSFFFLLCLVKVRTIVYPKHCYLFVPICFLSRMFF